MGDRPGQARCFLPRLRDGATSPGAREVPVPGRQVGGGGGEGKLPAESRQAAVEGRFRIDVFSYLHTREDPGCQFGLIVMDVVWRGWSPRVDGVVFCFRSLETKPRTLFVPGVGLTGET